ncbi:MAG: sensor histidine kinase, partial [Bacteroidia bacterium]
PIKSKNKSNQALCFYKTKDGQLLCGRNDGLYEVNASKITKLGKYPSTAIYSIAENNKQLVLGTSSKIIFLNTSGKIQKEVIPKYKSNNNTFSIFGEKPVENMVVDNYDRIWFTSYPNENVFLIDQNQTYDVFGDLGITPSLINQIFLDMDQNIWIGTFDNGILFIQNSIFNHITIKPSNKTLNLNKILFKDELLLTATNNGFYAFDIIDRNIKTICQADEILAEPVFDILRTSNGAYYSKRSQFDFNKKNISIRNKTYSFWPILGKLAIPYNIKQNIVCDWQANILLTNTDGSKVYDTLVAFPDYRLNISSLFTTNDSLLIGTNKGVYLYEFNKNAYHLLNKNQNQKVSDIKMVNGNLSILFDDEIWFIQNNKSLKKLGSKPIYGLNKLMYHEGYYWVITTEGLILCDLEFNPKKIINKQNGLLSNNINDITFNDSLVCFSTNRGVSITKTKDLINLNTNLQQVSLENIKVNQQNINISQFPIKLNSDQSNISITINSPLFTRPSKQFYRYKLDNLNWEYFDNITFSLPPLEGGEHNLLIQTSVDYLNWNEPLVLKFTKEVAFSETRYSFLVIIVSSVLILSFISLLVVRRIKKRALVKIQEEQQVNLLKHQAMNALLSPHFIFNSLTSIQNYINTNNSLKASEYLAKFSRLIRMIIEKASLQEIKLSDEIQRLTYYLDLEKERFKNKFDFVINVDPKIDCSKVTIPNMIIQPHAENCIIHGILPKMSHGHLIINFNLINEKLLQITLEDDGIGLIRAKENSKTGHKSLGTKTIQSILELNSQISGKKQSVSMIDKSTINPDKQGTIITIDLEL